MAGQRRGLEALVRTHRSGSNISRSPLKGAPMAPPPCTHILLKCALSGRLAFCRFLTLCGLLRPRGHPTVTHLLSSRSTRLVCAARDCHTRRTRLAVHDLGPKPPLSRHLSSCLSTLCACVQVLSRWIPTRRQRPHTPPARATRLPARGATSARARPPQPPTWTAPLSAAHHAVVGRERSLRAPRAVVRVAVLAVCGTVALGRAWCVLRGAGAPPYVTKGHVHRPARVKAMANTRT